jgi:hypothetical protein
MAELQTKTERQETQISVVEVERILTVGRLLMSVLTTEELETLRQTLYGRVGKLNGTPQIGNASDP